MNIVASQARLLRHGPAPPIADLGLADAMGDPLTSLGPRSARGGVGVGRGVWVGSQGARAIRAGRDQIARMAWGDQSSAARNGSGVLEASRGPRMEGAVKMPVTGPI